MPVVLMSETPIPTLSRMELPRMGMPLPPAMATPVPLRSMILGAPAGGTPVGRRGGGRTADRDAGRTDERDADTDVVPDGVAEDGNAASPGDGHARAVAVDDFGGAGGRNAGREAGRGSYRRS